MNTLYSGDIAYRLVGYFILSHPVYLEEKNCSELKQWLTDSESSQPTCTKVGFWTDTEQIQKQIQQQAKPHLPEK